MAKEPLYPHVPKKKEPQFPHGTGSIKEPWQMANAEWWQSKGLKDFTGDMRPVYAALDAGEYIPDAVIERLGGHISDQTYHRWATNRELYVVAAALAGKDVSQVPNVDLVLAGFPDLIPSTGPPRRLKLYQRGPDGYPLGADKRLREGYGPIPDPDQPFQGKKGWERPAEVYGWRWSDTFHRWTAFVRFPDGFETWTYPQHRAEGSLHQYLAKTEGDPISKYCCRQCGDCAPEELLEEGRFLDRITWLRQHYNRKHPGMWGEMSPMTIAGGELVKPEYRHLLDMVDEPLPPEAY